MRWYDPVPVMAAVAVVSTVCWVCVRERIRRFDLAVWQYVVLDIALTTAWFSLFVFAVEEVT